MEKIKVEFMNEEVEILDQVVSVSDIIKAKEGTVRAAIVFTEGLENEWDVCVSTIHPSKEFHSICIYPSNIFEVADEIDSEEECYLTELREQYCINLTLFDLMNTSEAELMKKLQRMDRIYSISIFGMYDNNLCSNIQWNDEKEQYSMMIQEFLMIFNEDGQRMSEYICDSRGIPDVKTKIEHEPYEYKVTGKRKCQWVFEEYLV